MTYISTDSHMSSSSLYLHLAYHKVVVDINTGKKGKKPKKTWSYKLLGRRL